MSTLYQFQYTPVLISIHCRINFDTHLYEFYYAPV